MGKTIQFHPKEKGNERYIGGNGIGGKSISINQIKENNSPGNNGSNFDITELIASKNDGVNFDIMNLLAYQNPEFKERQEIIEKYEKIKGIEGHINKTIYREKCDIFEKQNLNDLEQTAKNLSIEDLSSRKSYAMALFHTIFRKRKKNRGYFK